MDENLKQNRGQEHISEQDPQPLPKEEQRVAQSFFFNNKKLFIGIGVGFVFIAVISGGMFFFVGRQHDAGPIACTAEAKICPDGSYVGRAGPNCDFAECPVVNDRKDITDTTDWKTYRNEEYGFEIKYPGGWKLVPKVSTPDGMRGEPLRSPVGFTVIKDFSSDIYPWISVRTYVLDDKTLTIFSPTTLNLFNFRHIEGNNYEILGYQTSQPATRITIEDRDGLRGRTVGKANKGIISSERAIFQLDSGIFFALHAGDLEQRLFEQILSTLKFIEPKSTQTFVSGEEREPSETDQALSFEQRLRKCGGSKSGNYRYGVFDPQCLEEISLQAVSKDECFLLPYTDRKYGYVSCLTRLAIEQLDVSLCDLIPTNDANTRYSIIKDKYECINTIATQTKDVTLCSKVPPGRPDFWRGQCIESIKLLESDEAELIIAKRANEAFLALRDRDMKALSLLVHPDQGLRISGLVFLRDEIPGLMEDDKKYMWGYGAGSGLPIELTFKDYMESYLDVLDTAPNLQIGYNRILLSTPGIPSATGNLFEVYPSGILVDYYYPGIPNPMTWVSLRMMFIEKDSKWYLVSLSEDFQSI